ncbi:multidrug ABC transporter substrate-binding protein [Candidatus Roizmanbacteria bacterium CG11_big_fil_rev_8_21_14_0_20_37_16]|uniref:Multidrug ABC transporter substrate-binding protein n=2 Tax=Candidatus Roizmaniibacteriota TaxID=1752723 RepID=A0A2H0KKP7_9BACT|nr:MAG: multidrug ABC transporter substrate-binding protein [Candidatus Roizmanbacteria bacterium CG11_big_fil_rev_8_21_14_0_20_37_16]
MNHFIFVVKSAFEDFSRNKGRTFLTSLGIVIGVLSVVILIAFGLGLKKYINDQFQSLGSNIIRVVPGQILKGGSFSSTGSMSTIRFDFRDVLKLQRVKSAEYVIPVVTRSISVSMGKGVEPATLYASTADISVALNLNAHYGDIFTKSEVEKRSRIVVIGPKIAAKLFGSEEVSLGKTIKIDNQNFKVQGILEAKGGGGFGGPDLDSFIYMPHTTAQVFNPDKKFYAIIVKSNSDISIATAKEEIKTALLKRYKEDDFSVIDQAELLGAVESIFGMLNTVLVAIAAVSLVVGGIGIMNIMYVTVTERIKEIGIRRALGARASDILLQFLVESVALSILGGLMGLGLAYLIVFFIQSVFPTYIDLNSVMLALGVSTVIGVVFGVFPAKKAADLSPIDAIRNE